MKHSPLRFNFGKYELDKHEKAEWIAVTLAWMVYKAEEVNS